MTVKTQTIIASDDSRIIDWYRSKKPISEIKFKYVEFKLITGTGRCYSLVNGYKTYKTTDFKYAINIDK